MATIYHDRWYNGAATRFNTGRYSGNSEIRNASSLKLESDYVVTLYDQLNFQGNSRRIVANAAAARAGDVVGNVGFLGWIGNWNDRVVSMVVTYEPPAPVQPVVDPYKRYAPPNTTGITMEPRSAWTYIPRGSRDLSDSTFAASSVDCNNQCLAKALCKYTTFHRGDRQCSLYEDITSTQQNNTTHEDSWKTNI